MKFVFVCVSIVLSMALFAPRIDAKLEEKFHWKHMEFEWPNCVAEQYAIASGRYVVENNLPLGLERWNNKLFITVPRWKAGVASSLNYIDLDSCEKSPKLRPYPSWKANTLPAYKWSRLRDDSIISPFRVQVDACDRLWMLDTGLIDILDDAKRIAPTAIVVFDLKTDKLVRRFEVPEDQAKDETFFANIVVDSDRSECDNTYAYVPDLGAYGVVVYSFRNNSSYRVNHNFFHFDPLNGDFNVGGVNFQWTDGVLGMAVGPMKPDRSKDIYFHAMSSTHEFKVSNRVLQNESYVTSPDAYHDFKSVGDRGKNGQSSTEMYDKATGAIFYTQVNKDAVACWNVKRPYTAETQGLIDSNSTTLVFPNDLKVDTHGNVWVLTDRMPTFQLKELDPTDVNYRIMTGNTRNLIKGTPCEM